MIGRDIIDSTLQKNKRSRSVTREIAIFAEHCVLPAKGYCGGPQRAIAADRKGLISRDVWSESAVNHLDCITNVAMLWRNYYLDTSNSPLIT